MSYILILIIFLTQIGIPSGIAVEYPVINIPGKTQNVITACVKEVEIPAGSSYVIKFSAEQEKLLEVNHENVLAAGFSEKTIHAIVKAPRWIQRDLIRQFQTLENPEEYANLLLNVSKTYADEIAFSIACSPLGDVTSADVIENNTFALYRNDKWLSYADIIEYDDNKGGYYSTIQYHVLENDSDQIREYPKEIYYWYVVHPELLGEQPQRIYESFWRTYLFNHNDLGYPLMKEKLRNIGYLWDRLSYTQPGQRLWKDCIKEHPTAIEAVSYWIGKTVLYQAVGDRPNQPNIIAHEHNGWCGEIQRLAVAAQRTLLIPSIGACNIGEDHVWREFYERGWHQNDNWWTDSGGTVDIPYVYARGWGKDMSAIYSWRGDGSIHEVTSRYIPPEDRVTVTFNVKDMFLQPYDGALITVFVKGIKDISWYKNKLCEIIDGIWEKLPVFLKGEIFQKLYEKLEEKIEETPDVIDGLTVTIWNYTGPNGKCTFQLGKNDEYVFLIQEPPVELPWPFSKHSTIRKLSNPENTTFQVILPDATHIPHPSHQTGTIPSGPYKFNLSFETSWYQLQKNIRNQDVGKYSFNGLIDCLILDKENYRKYQNRTSFACGEYIHENKAHIEFNAEKQDWYIVFRNPTRFTHAILNVSFQVETEENRERTEIVFPSTTLFENPIFNIGDIVTLKGYATKEGILCIDGDIVQMIPKGYWEHLWNTTGLPPGDYTITASCGNFSDEKKITLIDVTPPEITVIKPQKNQVIDAEMLVVSGCCKDASGVKTVEIAVDSQPFEQADGVENWMVNVSLTGINPGMHLLRIKAEDNTGNIAYTQVKITVNESDHQWGPLFRNLSHTPVQPSNRSNIIVYADVISSSPFPLKNIVLYWINGTGIHHADMYLYASNPVQERHLEDPLQNFSNNPVYGCELGHFNNGETIRYWVIAWDMALNKAISEENVVRVS